jgi:hypothetical protein
MVVVLGEEKSGKTKLIENIAKSKFWSSEKPAETVSDISGNLLASITDMEYTVRLSGILLLKKFGFPCDFDFRFFFFC